MGRRRSRRRQAVAVVLVVLAAFSVHPTTARPEQTPSRVVLQALAARTGGTVDDMLILSTTAARYPSSGTTATTFKVMDERTGAIHLVALLEGREVHPERLRSQEVAAYSAKYGRLDPALADQVTHLPDDVPLAVSIWLREPPYTRPPRPRADGNATQQQIDDALRTAAEQRAAFVSRITAPVAARLRATGHEVDIDTTAPVLSTTLSAGDVKRVAAWPEIASVHRAQVPTQTLYSARGAIKADAVHTSGYTGSGVRTAQVEYGMPIASAHPALGGIVRDNQYLCTSAQRQALINSGLWDAKYDSHGTMVAGIIHSTNATNKGISPGSTHWAGGACPKLVAGKIDWAATTNDFRISSNRAVTWGANVINLSISATEGYPVAGESDKFYDSIVINSWRTVVAAAGNSGDHDYCEPPKNGNVGSPGRAYNVLTVGAFDDRNSASWTGDVMWPCSSWKNPASTYGDREKPDLVAPGVLITTTVPPSAFDSDTGTSFAAPIVTGAVALLMQRNIQLQPWPESLRAILQATSYNGVEPVKDATDKKAGAGGIDMQRASRTAGRIGNSGWGGEEWDCARPSLVTVATPYLTQGVRARVAIAWDNDPAWTSYSSRPSADLDLVVRRPNGTTVASSVSHDSTYELVDFVPDVSGNHQLQIDEVTCEYSPYALGWAWHNIQ